MAKTLKRQGDILFERITNYQPQGQQVVVQDGVIARGEVTGHAHKLEGGELRRSSIGMVAVADLPGARVVHEEHGPIELEPGVWLIRHQTEYAAKGETVDVYD